MDDVLMLSSGEKTVPAPMENIINANPYVNGTVMFGRARNQVGVLIEPRPGYEIDVSDEKQLAEFRNRVWSVSCLQLRVLETYDAPEGGTLKKRISRHLPSAGSSRKWFS